MSDESEENKTRNPIVSVVLVALRLIGKGLKYLHRVLSWLPLVNRGYGWCIVRVNAGLQAVTDRRRRTRKVLEDVYGRDQLGATFIIFTLTKMVELFTFMLLFTSAAILFGASVWLTAAVNGIALLIFVGYFLAGNWIFVNWESWAQRAEETMDSAAESAEKAEEEAGLKTCKFTLDDGSRCQNPPADGDYCWLESHNAENDTEEK